jgi:copper chaperone CopZ
MFVLSSKTEFIMVKKYIFSLLAVFLGGILFSGQNAVGLIIAFPTTGNCAICEIRIETAVSKIVGVQTVAWDMATDVTTVDYDENVTDCFAIMHAIADVGHDTEWFRAPDSAYNLLVGSCCEYERVISYDSVQIGYLSLMGIWMFPLGIENQQGVHLSAYPTIGPGLFQIWIDGQQSGELLKLSIYNLNGRKVENLTLNSSGSTTIDLQSFPDGQYIGVLNENKRNSSKVRLVKVR